jgi:hypothetical protein
MILTKESLLKQALKPRFKRSPGVDFPEQIVLSPLQRKYEWFKKRYSKTV